MNMDENGNYQFQTTSLNSVMYTGLLSQCLSSVSSKELDKSPYLLDFRSSSGLKIFCHVACILIRFQGMQHDAT